MIRKTGSARKKVILIVIDSLRPRSLAACLRRGHLPALEFLQKHGVWREDCVSVFPTMTPSCTASMITGLYPDGHEVPGFIWFHRQENRFVNYGATWKAIFNIGPTQVLRDLIYNLNGRHLNSGVRTVYELLEDAGFSSININFFAFRGYHSFPVAVPWWVNLLTGGRLKGEVVGPPRLVLGRAVPPRRWIKGAGLKTPVSVFNKFGINDEFSGTVTHWTIKEGSQPDLSVVYLPDTDGYTHRHHTAELAPSLVEADRQVQKILNAFPTWEKALEENVFLVTGDHAQSLVGKRRQSIIHLGDLLSRYTQAEMGGRIAGRQLALCPNERMGYVYFLEEGESLLLPVVKKLSMDPRIDQICWREEDNGSEKFVICRGGEKGRLEFKIEGPYADRYGQRWSLEGDFSILDLKITGNNLQYGDYPDCLRCISALLRCTHAGDIAVTAKPGFEIDGDAAPTHRGKGSHGSLHREDILVPLIVAGDEVKIENPRIVDLVPYILQNFGVEFSQNVNLKE